MSIFLASWQAENLSDILSRAEIECQKLSPNDATEINVILVSADVEDETKGKVEELLLKYQITVLPYLLLLDINKVPIISTCLELYSNENSSTEQYITADTVFTSGISSYNNFDLASALKRYI